MRAPRNPKQIAGCLPTGFTLDSMLSPDQFCRWQQVGRAWFSKRLATLPGVVSESREHCRIHPRTYLEKRVSK